MARTWILTGSPENYAATADHDFAVIGHWTLAFQGQIRPVSDHDSHVLTERMSKRVGAPT